MGLGMDGNRLFDSKTGVEFNTSDKARNTPGQEIWLTVKAHLATILNAADYDRWIDDLRLVAEVDGEMVIAARDPLSFDRVNGAHRHAIQRIWREHDHARRAIRLVCWRSAPQDLLEIVKDPWEAAVPAQEPKEQAATAEQKAAPTGAPLMTFDTLVTGEANELAFEMARRIAAGLPVGTLTTLFYGLQGTGKTHLLHALKAEAERNDADCHIVYLTAEEFLSSYTDGVKVKDTSQLKKRLRAASILMIDDLHRISGKPGTENELFQNIREVTANGGHVILAGDKAPGDVTGFSPRMVSELKGATTVEVGAPDASMRHEIMRRLADHIQAGHPDFIVTDEMISEFNAGIRGQAREMTGAIWNLYTEASFGARTPTMDMVRKIIRRTEGDVRQPSIELVKKAAMKVFDISKTDIESPSKARNVVYPRQIAMYLCRELTGKSFPQIGRSFGKRDHTTILYAHRKVTDALQEDRELAAHVKQVNEMILELQAAGMN